MKLKLEGGQEFEIPEGFKSVEEFVAKYNEEAQRAATAQAAVEAYKAKVGDLDTFEGRLQKLVDGEAAKAAAAAKAEVIAAGGTKKEGADAAKAVLEGWADLTPQQQIDYITNSIGTNLQQKLESMVAEKWAIAEKALQGAGGQSQQQFELLAEALGYKLNDPSLDLGKLWGEMTNIAKLDQKGLMKLAIDGLKAGPMMEARIKEEKAKWEEESTKKQNADKLKVLNSDSTALFKQRTEDRPSLNKPGGEEAMKRSILERALTNGTIEPAQL